MAGRRNTIWITVLASFALAAPAHAAFPGANGKIAFESNRDGDYKIFTANSDGTGATALTPGPCCGTDVQYAPAWSPDGQQVAFSCFGIGDLCIVNADGTGVHSIYSSGTDVLSPTWSPDGTALVFGMDVKMCDTPSCSEPWLVTHVMRINPDGTGFTDLSAVHNPSDTVSELDPAWLPDGTKIGYGSYPGPIATMNPDGTAPADVVSGYNPSWSPDGSKVAYSRYTSGTDEIYVANADGTGETRLTNNAVHDRQPAWSPDGKQIVFASNEGGDYEIFMMYADGSSRHAVTNNTSDDSAPDWQPIPLNYVRPRGAGPFLTYLVPAYTACMAPNRMHGSPLASGSCAPPAQASSRLTVGTPDSNGHAATTIAAVRYSVMPGPGDVRIAANVTGVLTKSALTAYSGELSLDAALRITDRNNTPNPGGPGPATVQDTSFPVTVPCGSGSCSVATTANAVVPGAVLAGKRAIWQLGQVTLYDGGADGVASTASDNTLFMVQGVFVP